MALTGFFIVGIRPVKIFRTAEGGLDCQVLDWRTGGFVRDIGYLSRVQFDFGADVEEVSEADFAVRLEALALRRWARPASDGAADLAVHAAALLRLADRAAEVGLWWHAERPWRRPSPPTGAWAAAATTRTAAT
jgi:hypothetical protein